MKISYEELVKYLKEKDADYDEISQPLYNINNISEWVYDISGTWLDWKHGWGYLRWCMEQIEYVEIFNKVTEEDGSDCWSGVSRFVLKEVVEFYNKKQNEKAE